MNKTPRISSRFIFRSWLLFLFLASQLSAAVSGTATLTIVPPGSAVLLGPAYGGVWDGTQILAPAPVATGHHLTLRLINTSTTEVTNLNAVLTLPAGYHTLANTATVTTPSGSVPYTLSPASPSDAVGGRTFTLPTLPTGVFTTLAIDIYATTGAVPLVEGSLAWSWSAGGAPLGNTDVKTTVQRGKIGLNMRSEQTSLKPGDTGIFTATISNTGTAGSFFIQMDPRAMIDQAQRRALVFVNWKSETLPTGSTVDPVTQVLSIPYLYRAAEIAVQFNAIAEGCGDLSGQMTASDIWLRDQVPSELVTAGVALLLDPAEPKLAFTTGPPTVAVPYGAWKSASLTLTNQGQGRASAIEVATYFPSSVEIRFPAPNTEGWTWNASRGRFVLPVTRNLAASAAITLTFEARISAAAAGPAIAQQPELWQVFSKNLCGQAYSSPAATGTFSYVGAPSLSLSMTPDKPLVQKGDTQNVALTLKVSDPSKIDVLGTPPGITITVPAPTALLTYVSATGPGIFDSIGDGCTWRLTPAQLDANGAATLTIRVRFNGDPLACPGGQRAPMVASVVAKSTPWPVESPGVVITLTGNAATELVTVTNADGSTDPSAYNFALDGTSALVDGWRTGLTTGPKAGEEIPFRARYPIAVADAVWSKAGYTHVGEAVGPVDLVAGSLQYTLTGRSGEGTISGAVPGAAVSFQTASSITTGFAIDLSFIETDLTTAGWTQPAQMFDRTLSLTYRLVAQDRTSARVIARQLAQLSLSGLASGTCPSQPGVTQYIGYIDVPLVRGEAIPNVAMPDLIDAGVPFTTTVTVTNPRAAAAKDVVVTLDSLSSYELIGTPVMGGGFTQVGSTAEFTAPTLAAGASATITLQLRLPLAISTTPEVRFNSVWNSIQGSGTTPADFSANGTDRPVAVRRASLLLQVAPTVLTIDRTALMWSLYVTNAGAGAAPFVTATCDLPPEFTLGSIQVVAATQDGVDVLGSLAVSVTAVSGVHRLRVVRPENTYLPSGGVLQLQISGALQTGTTSATMAGRTQPISVTWGTSGGMDAPATTSQTYRSSTASVSLAISPNTNPDDPSSTQTPDMGSASSVYAAIRNNGQCRLYDGVWIIEVPTATPLDGSRELKFRTRSGQTNTAFAPVGMGNYTVTPTGSGQRITITGSSAAMAGSLVRALSELVPFDRPASEGINSIQLEIPFTVTEDAVVPPQVISGTIDMRLPLSGDESMSSTSDKGSDSLNIVPKRPQLTARTRLANATVAPTVFTDTVAGGYGDEIRVQVELTNNGTVAAGNLALRFILPSAVSWSGPVTISGPGAPSGTLVPNTGVYLVPIDVGQTIAPGATMTWIMSPGFVYGATNVTWTVDASCGTDTNHFDLSTLQTTDDALLLLKPEIDPNGAVLFTTTTGPNARLSVDCTLSNVGGTAIDPKIDIDLTGAPFLFPTGSFSAVTPIPPGLVLTSVTQTGSILSVMWTGVQRGGEAATVRFALLPTRTDTTVDPTQIPEVAADPVGDIAATVGGTVTVKDTSPGNPALPGQVFSGVVFNATTPDLDVTAVNPQAALVRDGQRLTITSTIVNNGETGSIAEVPQIELLEIGGGWLVPEVQIVRDGVAGSILAASVGQKITLADLPRWTGGTAGNPTSNGVQLRFTGTASAAANASLAWRFRLSNRIRSATGVASSGELSRDEARATILGFNLLKSVVSSTEVWSSDVAPRTVLVGEETTDQITATWFGGDVSNPITAISLVDRLASGATGISATNSGVVSGTNVTWTQTSFPGSGSISGNVTARPNKSSATSIVADGKAFDDIADATFTYLGTVFGPSTTGFPASTQRQITRTIREPNPTLSVQVSTTAGGSFGSSVSAGGGDVRYIKVTLTNAANRSPAYDSSVGLVLPTGLTLASTPAVSSGAVSGTTTLAWTGLSAVSASGIETLTCAVTVDAAIDLGRTLTLNGSSQSDSLSAALPANERTYARSSSATIVADRETIALVQNSSTESTTTGTTLLIGERSDWTTTSVVPVGQASALVVRLRIPRGMTCAAQPTVALGSAIAAGNPTWTVMGSPAIFPLTASAGDVDLLATFGSRLISAGTSAERTLTVQGGVYFTNATGVGTAGGEISAATLTAGISNGTSGVPEVTASLAHTAIEPPVTLTSVWRNVTAGDPTNFATFTRPDAGDTLELRLTTTAATTTASDLLVVADLTGMTYGSLVSAVVAGTDRTAALAPEVSGSTVRFGRGVSGHAPITLQATQTAVIVLRTTLAGTIAPDTALAIGSTADWTSLTGAVVIERSGSGVAPDDYRTTAALSQTSRSGPTVTAAPGTKSLTNGWRAGETVTWTITLDALPEGTLPMTQVTQALPVGLVLTGVTAAPTTGVTAPTITVTVPATTSAVIGLGTLIVAPDNVAGDRLVLTCTGYTSVDLPRQALTSLAAQATVQWQRANASLASASATATLPIVQPVLAVTAKSVLSPAGQVEAGGSVSWRITARNSGDGPSYVARFRDVLPGTMTGLTVISGRIGGISLPVAVAGNDLVATLPVAGWRSSETIEIDMRATVPLGTAPATSLVNTAGLQLGESLPAGSVDYARVRTYGPQSPLISAPAVTVDNVPPTVPVITGLSDDTGDVASDGVTNDRLVAIRGTTRVTDAAVTVEIYLAGNLLGTTPVAADGSWSFADPGPARADGAYAWTAKALDVSSNRSPASAPYAMIVDTVAPTVDVTDLLTNNSKPTLTGVVNDAAPSSGISRLQVTVAGRNYVLGDGFLTLSGTAWTLNLAAIGAPLTDGPYDVAVAARDLAGNPVIDLVAGTLTVDTTPPAAPTVMSLISNQRKPTLHGTVSSDSVTLTVTIDGQVYTAARGTTVGGLTVANNGIWTLVVGANLADGTYDVAAVASDAAGNPRTDLTINEVVIDTMAPPAPTIERLATNERSPEIRGTAPAGNALSVTLNGATYALPSGSTWALNLTTLGVVLADGIYPVTVAATDAAGNRSEVVSATGLTIDTIDGIQVPAGLATLDWALATDATDPIFRGSAPANGVLTATIGGQALSTTADGMGRFALTATGAADGRADVELVVTGGRTRWVTALTVDRLTAFTVPTGFPTIDGPRLTDIATPTVRGNATAGSTVSVSIDNGAASAVTANGSGRWARSAGTLADGLHVIAAEDGQGRRTELTRALRIDTSVSFTVPTGYPTLELPALTNNPRPTATGTSPVGPVSVRVDNGPITSSPVANNGTWSQSLGLLSDGPHRVAVSSGDGWITDRGRPTIDTVAPTLPTVQTLRTNDQTPLLTGTSDAGTTLTVTVAGVTYVQGVDAALAVDAQTGAWSLAVPVTVAQGPYDVTVVSTDPAGNSSTNAGVNGRRDLVVDITPPLISVKSLLTNKTQPVLTGFAGDPLSGVNGLEVTIKDKNDTVVGVFTLGVDAALVYNPQRGIWTLDLQAAGLSLPASGNDYSVTALATDGAGNSNSAVAVLKVDTTGPTATVTSLATNNPQPTLVGTASDINGIKSLTITVATKTYVLGVGTELTFTYPNWTLRLPMPEADGVYDVAILAVDNADNPGNDETINELTIDTVRPVVTAVTVSTSNVSPVLRGTLDDPMATLTVSVAGVGTFTAGDGRLVLAGGVGPAWTLNLVGLPPVSEGDHAITATATDAVGNVGTAVATLTIDTTPPTAPTVTPLAVSSSAPTISGTCDPTGILTVSIAGRVFVQGDPALVITGSTWQLNLATAGLTLADGTYDVSAESVDGLGNRAVDSTLNELRIDTTPPAAPTVIALLTNVNAPLLSGTSDPAGGLRVTVAGVTYVAGINAELQRSGATWTLQLPTLIAGTYDVTAVGFDDLGNAATDATAGELLIDRTPPRAPTVDRLTTANPNPVISGTAEVTAGLSVAIDGVTYVLGRDPQLTQDVSGVWRLDLSGTLPLTTGAHQIVATSTDAAGNPAVDTTINEVIIDDQPPVVTVRSQIANNGSPRVSGTARDIWSSVTALRVTIDGQTVAWPGSTALVLINGRWTLDLAIAGIVLADGVYDVTAAATDGVGNIGVDPTSAELVIDSHAPTVTVDALITNDTTPTLTGTCNDPLSVLFVTVNGVTYSTANPTSGLVLSGGRWSVTVPVLSDGIYEVRAVALDSAFNVGTDGTVDELTIDTVKPAKPIIAGISPDTGTPGDFITSEPRPTTSGTAEPGSTVTLYVNGIFAVTVLTATDGSWAVRLPSNLADGLYQLTATATDPAGNVSDSSDLRPMTIDQVCARPIVASTGPDTGVIGDGITSNPRQTAVGSAEPGSTVTVMLDGVVLGTVVANTQGAWSFGPTAPLPDGRHEFTASAVDIAGNASPVSLPLAFTLDTSAFTMSPTVTAITPGVLTATDAGVSNSTHPTISGKADPLATLEIRIDGVVVGTASASLSGSWSLSLSGLGEGPHVLTLTSQDVAGNPPRTSTFTLTVDLTAPIAPVITGLFGNGESVPEGGATIDQTPMLTGTAEAGNSVGVYADGVLLGTALAAADGTWIFTVPTDLARDELVVFTAISTDTALNPSVPSQPWTALILQTHTVEILPEKCGVGSNFALIGLFTMLLFRLSLRGRTQFGGGSMLLALAVIVSGGWSQLSAEEWRPYQVPSATPAPGVGALPAAPAGFLTAVAVPEPAPESEVAQPTIRYGAKFEGPLYSRLTEEPQPRVPWWEWRVVVGTMPTPDQEASYLRGGLSPGDSQWDSTIRIDVQALHQEVNWSWGGLVYGAGMGWFRITGEETAATTSAAHFNYQVNAIPVQAALGVRADLAPHWSSEMCLLAGVGPTRVTIDAPATAAGNLQAASGSSIGLYTEYGLAVSVLRRLEAWDVGLEGRWLRGRHSGAFERNEYLNGAQVAHDTYEVRLDQTGFGAAVIVGRRF